MNAFDAALDEAGIENEISIYEGQPHAFVEDAQGIQAGGAQGQAWAQMLAFLKANLQNTSASSNHLSLADYHASFAWKYYAMLVYEHAFGTASHSMH